MGRVSMGPSHIGRRPIGIEPVKVNTSGSTELSGSLNIIEIIKEVPVEKIVYIETIKEVPTEVVRVVTQTIEVPVEVIKERTIFVDRPFEVVREVKIIDIEKLMLAQAEVRNLNSAVKIYRILLAGAIIVAIALGVR